MTDLLFEADRLAWQVGLIGVGHAAHHATWRLAAADASAADAVDLTGTNAPFAVVAVDVFGLDSAEQVRVSTVDTDAATYTGVDRRR